MTSAPLISVIIPSYNSKAFIKDAIESVCNQTYQHTEIIVVDDGSADNSYDYLKQIQNEFSFKLIQQKNQGPGVARNNGIKSAKGQYLCFLDSDDQLMVGSLEKRLQLLEKYPEVDLVFTDLKRLDNRDKPGYEFLKSRDFLKKFRKAVAIHKSHNVIFNDKYFDCAIQYFPFIWTSTVMIRSEVVNRIGYFHPHWRGSEDIDYWLRIARQGTIAYIDEALTEWHHYYSNLTKLGNYQFYVDTICCYKNIKKELGNKQYLKKLINKRLGHYAFAGGYEALAVKALQPARKFFSQSCLFNPFEKKYWFYAIVSTLPAPVFFKLRELKQKNS